MIKSHRVPGLIVALALAATPLVPSETRLLAQTPKASDTPLKIQVVISRYQGEKKLSSLPYSLTVTGGGGGIDRAMVGPSFVGRANLRMGAKVPIVMLAMPSVDGKPLTGIPAGGGPIQYQDVGTNIDCSVWSVDDGRFRVELGIEDTSVYPDEKETPGMAKGTPSFRSFRASDSMLLRDGATGQFTTATDKVSGETVRVDVTLTVVK